MVSKWSSLVREFEKVSDRKMLKVNERKSKVLKFRLSGEEEPLIVSMGSDDLDAVSKFKYLRSLVSANGSMEAELENMPVNQVKIIGGLE